MPQTDFCEWHDHQECTDRARENKGKNYCECDCHLEQGWMPAKLIKWKIQTLKVSGGQYIEVWFRDSKGVEWLWNVGVWSAAKMMGVKIPKGANPLSMVKVPYVVNRLSNSQHYEIKLGEYRVNMRKKAEVELRIQYVRVKKE